MKVLFIVNPASGGKVRTRAVTGSVSKVFKGANVLFIVNTA